MIPNIIHYCWFGGNPLPEIAVKCISSWKKYFPDYEIKEWNEDNFDLNCCEYVREAYQAKKWAFVSDYARFWILYNYGGLYFDTDVEVIKDMSDIIANGAFMGCEVADKCAPGLGLGVNPGPGQGGNPGLGLYKEILENYQQSHFLNSDGSNNYETVVDRTTNILKKYGFKESNTIQKIADVMVYPPEYFCPMDYTTGKLNITESSRSIHWYDASWLDDRMKKRRARSEKIRNIIEGKAGIRLSKIYMTCSYYWEWITTGKWSIIKQKLLNKVKRSK